MCVVFRLGAQESKELIILCTNFTVRLNLISTLHITLLEVGSGGGQLHRPRDLLIST